MADQLQKKWELGGTIDRDLDSEQVQERYQVLYDSIPSSFVNAYSRARAEGLPSRTSQYLSTSLFFKSANSSVSDGNRRLWFWDVTWAPLPPGRSPGDFDENPLARPPQFDIQRRETDFPIVTGRNVEKLPRADNGAERAADTEGRVVNSAGDQPDEQFLDSIGNPVIVIRRNFAILNEIVSINLDWQLTTNSSPINGWTARRLKFLSAESLGRREENDVVYYPCEIRIEVMKTTDLTFDNVGPKAWIKRTDGTTEVYEKEPVKTKVNGKTVDSNVPANLAVDGTQLAEGDPPESISYRYLTETDYTTLFT